MFYIAARRTSSTKYPPCALEIRPAQVCFGRFLRQFLAHPIYEFPDLSIPVQTLARLEVHSPPQIILHRKSLERQSSNL